MQTNKAILAVLVLCSLVACDAEQPDVEPMIMRSGTLDRSVLDVAILDTMDAADALAATSPSAELDAIRDDLQVALDSSDITLAALALDNGLDAAETTAPELVESLEAATAESAELMVDSAAQRIAAGEQAGDEYIDRLEEIRDELDDSESGTTLGTMVASQLALTEAETRYQVRAGIPNKASKMVKAAADQIKQAAG